MSWRTRRDTMHARIGLRRPNEYTVRVAARLLNTLRLPGLILAFCICAVLSPSAAAEKPAARTVTTADSAKPAPAKPTPSKPAPANPAPAPSKPVPARKITEGQKDFCNLIRHCGLPEPAGYCPPPADLEKPSFTYDSARCLEARLLNGRGVTPTHPVVGYKLYRFLGMEYRIIYNVEDALPISEARLAYLLADLPLAARLVSHFRKEAYTAEYLDTERKAFKGTKGKRLRGEARLISGDTGEKRLFYFGYGMAEVAFWKLKGPALMDFTYGATGPGALKYKMKLLVFPGNGVINSIMNLGMFRKVVLGKIKEVLVDITESAKQLAAGGGAELLRSKAWSAEEKRKIEEFLKLP